LYGSSPATAQRDGPVLYWMAFPSQLASVEELNTGTSLVATVFARNSQGAIVASSSSGIVLDSSPPGIAIITPEGITDLDGAAYINKTVISARWECSDDESGVDDVLVSLHSGIWQHRPTDSSAVVSDDAFDWMETVWMGGTLENSGFAASNGLHALPSAYLSRGITNTNGSTGEGSMVGAVWSTRLSGNVANDGEGFVSVGKESLVKLGLVDGEAFHWRVICTNGAGRSSANSSVSLATD